MTNCNGLLATSYKDCWNAVSEISKGNPDHVHVSGRYYLLATIRQKDISREIYNPNRNSTQWTLFFVFILVKFICNSWSNQTAVGLATDRHQWPPPVGSMKRGGKMSSQTGRRIRWGWRSSTDEQGVLFSMTGMPGISPLVPTTACVCVPC